MKPVIFAISLASLCQLRADNLTSPNGLYKVEYVEALEHETNVKLKNAKTGKVLDVAISYGYHPEKYHEIAWSPDSRYLAVISRGTRTGSQVEVFSFIGDTVEEVTIPSPKLGDGSWPGGRSQFVKHLKWEGTTLKYYCYGDKVDGAGDADLVPDNWYHFDIALKFGGRGEEAAPKVVSVTATAPKWRGEQADTGLDKMTVDELEAYLTPPIGTKREDVEGFFGFSFSESGVNGDEDTKVLGYALFHPVYMEAIYAEGKVAKSGMHHEVNLSDWNSEWQLDITQARLKAPEKTNEWLKQGYLHYVRGRNLLNAVQFPAWCELPSQESKQSDTGQPAARPNSDSEGSGNAEPEIPLNVDNVTRGGWWKDSDKEGYLRFCAFQRGHEHVSHQVVIEWVEESGSPDVKKNIISRVVIKDIPTVWSVSDAKFVVKDGKTLIQFEGTNSYAPDKQAKFSIEIQGVGKAKVTTTE